MLESIAFIKELLIKPSKALARLRSPDAALRESLAIYLLYIATAVLFYAFKPEDFPPVDEAAQWAQAWGGYAEPHGLWFWAQVQAWTPFLTAIQVVFLGWFAWLLRPRPEAGRPRPNDARSKPVPLGRPFGGSLVYAAAVIAGMVPIIPMLLYKNDVISKPIFAASWAVLLGAMIPGLRRRSLDSWKTLASLSMALNIVDVALLLPFITSVLLRQAAVYHALEIVVMAWTVGLGAYLLSRIENISTARAFLALMLSVALCPVLFVFSAYLLGLLPREILKAMMAV